jgi:hypothetical protein
MLSISIIVAVQSMRTKLKLMNLRRFLVEVTFDKLDAFILRKVTRFFFHLQIAGALNFIARFHEFNDHLGILQSPSTRNSLKIKKENVKFTKQTLSNI